MEESIIISQLDVIALVGVDPIERAAPQRLTVSLRLLPQRGFAGLADDIANTVDYAAVCDAIRDETGAKSRHLIETLAEDIATMVLDRFPLRAVEVEVRKYILPFAQYAAVHIRAQAYGGISMKRREGQGRDGKGSASLIVADSERSADMLYATRFFAPDPFIFLDADGRRSVVLSDLEVDRGRRDARVDEVIAFSDVKSRIKSRGKTEPDFEQVLVQFLREKKIRRARVPYDFPAGVAAVLAEAGIRLDPVRGLFWPQREHKTGEEVKAVGKALRITEAGMARAMEVLRASRISGRNLIWANRKLTSEILRAEIDSAILRAGGIPANTIVAGGLQACDPHERGSGPLAPARADHPRHFPARREERLLWRYDTHRRPWPG